MYLNIQGILTNITELKLIIRKIKPLIVILSETHVTDDIQDSELMIRDYDLCRCDSESRHTGGVIIYVKNDLKHEIIDLYVIPMKFWAMSVRVEVSSCITVNRVKNLKTLNIVAVYRSPSSPVNTFLQKIRDIGQSLSQNEVNLIVGDFNIDMSKFHGYSKHLRNTINELGMMQCVRFATRKTQHSQTMIDLVLTNEYETMVREQENDKISDHATLLISVPITTHSIQQPKTFKIIKYSCDELNGILQKTDWARIKLGNVNEMVDHVDNALMDCVSRFTKNICFNPNKNAWYTEKLRGIKKKRDISYRNAKDGNENAKWAIYKQHRNAYVKELNEAKNNDFINRLKLKGNDSKAIWTLLKSIIKNEQKIKTSSVMFGSDNEMNENVIATKFNK